MLSASVLLTIAVSLLSVVSLLFLAQGARGTDWMTLWMDETWRDSLGITLYVVLASTCMSLLIGTWLARTVSFRQWPFVSRVLRLPMFVPHIAAAYLFLILFSGQSGGGWFDANEPHYVTVILTYVWKEVPFVFLMMGVTYEQVNQGYRDMARTLQLSPVQQFRHAELPFLIKPLLDTFWILTAFISFAYEVPSLLGVTYPKLLGVLAYDRLSTGLYLESSEPYAVALVWTVFVTGGVVVSYMATHRLRRRIERGVRR
ncbi:ABC transporter permease [Exiguobacterium algae]|uniref:ABC transporter permease n=1 Tax=Exiguobacterium algae TaxID=2751250 RepID=UPI001BE89EB5